MLFKKLKLRRCPYCNSIWVCWNWFHVFNVDRKKDEESNPHIDPKKLKEWFHECWDCEKSFDTYNKVKNGIPYFILKKFYWKVKGK